MNFTAKDVAALREKTGCGMMDCKKALIASNGESIAMSEEGYKSKSGVMNGLKSVSINSVDAEIVDETLEK